MWPCRASALAIAMIVSGGSHSACVVAVVVALHVVGEADPDRAGRGRRRRWTPSWLAVARPERSAAAFRIDGDGAS